MFGADPSSQLPAVRLGCPGAAFRMFGVFWCSGEMSKGNPPKCPLSGEPLHGTGAVSPGLRVGNWSTSSPSTEVCQILALPHQFWLCPRPQPCCWGGKRLPLLLGTAYGFQRGSCFKPNFTVGLTEAKGGQTIRLRSLNKWLRLNLNPRRCPFPALAVPAGPDGLLNAASRSSAFSLPHCSPLWASECRTLKVRVIWIRRVRVILFNDMDLQERA